jgi:hypothetical protein
VAIRHDRFPLTDRRRAKSGQIRVVDLRWKGDFSIKQESVLFYVLIKNGLSQRRKDRKVMDENDEC